MKLYLIRHGKTIANEKHVYCGATDLPLSDKGVDELQKFHYEVPENCRFLTSGMLRTEQTLYHLFGKIEHKVDERFREIDFGMFEMKGYEELKNQPEYQTWISGDNEKNVPPMGESGEQMTSRVMKGIKELLEQKGNIVLITHGGVIVAIMEQLFPEENKNRYEWQPAPGGGYVITKSGYDLLKRMPKEEKIYESNV